MKKFFKILALLLCSFYTIAQDEGKEENRSYVQLGSSFSNSSFSLNNPGINTISSVNKTITSPYVYYSHKSGFNLTANLSIADGGVFQSSFAAGYDYASDNLEAGVSFTKSLPKNLYSAYINVLQNDFSGYFTYTKNMIQPGMSINISNGKYNEAYNYLQRRRLVLFNPLRDTFINVMIRDSSRNKISNVNTSFYVQHYFAKDNWISENDNFELTSSIMLNAGNQKLTSSNTTAIYGSKIKKPKTETSNTIEKERFQFQSIGINFDANYTFNHFFISPQLYIDKSILDNTKAQFFFTLALGAKF